MMGVFQWRHQLEVKCLSESSTNFMKQHYVSHGMVNHKNEKVFQCLEDTANEPLST